MAEEILVSLSVVIGISALLAILARIIKHPPIIAYIITGILAGPLFLNLLSSSSDTIQIFSRIGVAFLLFIVGLNLDIRVLKEVGKVSLFAGISEIVVTASIAFLIAYIIGFGGVTSLYIATALAFSSTVVVVKILSDKKEIDTLHGRIALGILIVEDFVAALALMIIPLVSSNFTIYSILLKLGTAILLIALVFSFSIFFFNRFMNYLARSQEALFLFGVSWALVLATIFNLLGFSLEIGALIAGMSLASSKYTLELGGKIKPLRDFFVVLFFVFFGSQLATAVNFHMIKLALLFSLFIFMGKPIIIMSLLKIFGYKKRTNFLAGSAIAQISEFSLIISLLAFHLGHMNQEIISLIVLIALITIGLSSYSIHYSGTIFKKLSGILQVFEGNKYCESKCKEEDYEVILFGYHRLGYKILKSLQKMKKKFVVVDYNPKVILALAEKGINAIYGDAADESFLSEIKLESAKLVISTIPEENPNLAILEKMKKANSKAVFIATAEHSADALNLYLSGADFVIVPQHLGGDYMSDIIPEFTFDRKKYKSLGEKHFKEISEGKKNSNYSTN